MTGPITTPNGTFGIIVGDDSRLADRNVANTLFIEGNQNTDRGYINFSQTAGNDLGAINAGNLTWRGNIVWHAGNITPVTNVTASSPLASSGGTTPNITIQQANGSQSGFLSSTDWTTFNNKANSVVGGYLPLTGGTMTGVITTPNGTFGIVIGDDSRLADRNVVNTLFLEGVQNDDRGFINFSQTTGNALGAVNGGNLTWRGNTVVTGGGSDGQVAYWSSGSSITGESNLFWDATNDRLGIGTNIPAYKVHVQDSGSLSRILIDNTSNAALGSGIWMRTLSGGSQVSNATVRTDNAGNFQIFNGTSGDTENLRIFLNGNVVIQSGGTFSNAGFKLDVNGTGRFSGNLRTEGVLAWNGGVGALSNGTGFVTVETNSETQIRLITNSNPALTVDTNQRIGIGTLSPEALLTISGTNQALGGAFNTYGNSLITSNESPAINIGGSISLGGRYFTGNTIIASFGRIHGKKENASDGSTAGYLSFETILDATAALSEKMRITSVGNVGINTGSPVGGAGSGDSRGEPGCVRACAFRDRA
jgi:hypothetical protein